MAFRDIVNGVKNFFGPNNTFFNGAPESGAEDEGGRYTPQAQGASMPVQQEYESAPMPAQESYPQGQFQQPYPQQPYMQQGQYAQMQAQQPMQQPSYQNSYQNSPLQQGYQPQQTVSQPYVQPRNRRSAQHQQQPVQQPENVVPFPGGAQQGYSQQPAAQSQQTAGKTPAACVVNIRTIADCRLAISQLHEGDYVLAVIDNVADKADVRRYVDTLNGACFSLNCSITRLSARVGLYLLAPQGMQVYTDASTTQMNAQSRAPQRAQRAAMPQSSPFRSPYAAQQSAASPYVQAPYLSLIHI